MNPFRSLYVSAYGTCGSGALRTPAPFTAICVHGRFGSMRIGACYSPVFGPHAWVDSRKYRITINSFFESFRSMRIFRIGLQYAIFLGLAEGSGRKPVYSIALVAAA
ncbi:hypothetical protein [Caballeronia glebae]|jgi:hypothetical protein|uniref:hypothetical protein n=1 Tax=Caballeronia glebae TaxID=1777143 RepID=UPI000A57C5F6|nr:hypothetical protein [Caballeronia glebae]